MKLLDLDVIWCILKISEDVHTLFINRTNHFAWYESSFVGCDISIVFSYA